MRRAVLFLSTVAVVLAFVGVREAFAGWVPPPANPHSPGTGGSGGTPPSSTPQTAQGNTGSTTYGTVNDCHYYGGPGGMGLSCGGLSGQWQSIKTILAGAPVPTCWDEQLTDAEVSTALAYHDGKFVYYWHRCVYGIDPHTFTAPNGVTFTEGIIWFVPGTPKCSKPSPGDKKAPCLMWLTPEQTILVAVKGGSEYFPYPVAVATPSPAVRVNENVAFVDGTRTSKQISVGGVQMRAYVVPRGFSVASSASDPRAATCSGTKAAGANDAPRPGDDRCWMNFTRSSAGEPNDTFRIRTEDRWQIDIDYGTGWQPLNSFTKWQDTEQKVTEIQTVVVR